MFFLSMQTIGEQLKHARLGRGLALSEVAKATAIRVPFLEALEADEFDALPSLVQTRGFLRSYATYLGLQPAPLLEQLRPPAPPEAGIQKVQEGSPTEVSGPSPQPMPATGPPPEARGSERQTTDSAEDRESRPNISAAAPGVSAMGLRPHRPAEPTDAPISPNPPDLVEDGPEEWKRREDASPAAEHESIPLSRSIFLEIGQQLRQRRELLSLSLDEIERHTRIPQHHLATLEAGRFEEMPSPVQARGTLTAYARFIDLDPETILLRFADALQAQRRERFPLPPRRRPPKAAVGPLSAVRRFLSTDLVFGGGLVLAIAIFAVWGAARIITIRAQKTDAVNAQSISQVLLATQQGIATPSPTTTEGTTETANLPLAPAGPILTPTSFPTRFSTAPVQLIVIANSRTWMRITVDGKIEFEGRTTPGNAYSFDGEKQIELLVADAGAVQLIYNRENVGSPGNAGGVANLIYTADAVLLPTPTITPSPTRTPRPSATPRPTSTPRLTPTPPVTSGPIG